MTTKTNNFLISLVRNSAFVIMQSEVKTTTKFGFEVQLSKGYTRAELALTFVDTFLFIGDHLEIMPCPVKCI